MPLPEGIAAVFFDAGGTLIHAEPSPGDVYAEVGRRFGSRVDAATARARFRDAFRRRQGHPDLTTSEAVEDAFWRGVVAEVLADVTADGCYRTLFAHFARPEAWRADPEAATVLPALAERGLLIGLCSNFDTRLHGIVAGLPELRAARRVVVSSEVGWRKPAPAFFAAVARAAALPPERILVVGDDPVNDYQGARAAGMAARLLDPHGRFAGPDRISSLANLLR